MSRQVGDAATRMKRQEFDDALTDLYRQQIAEEEADPRFAVMVSDWSRSNPFAFVKKRKEKKRKEKRNVATVPSQRIFFFVLHSFTFTGELTSSLPPSLSFRSQGSLLMAYFRGDTSVTTATSASALTGSTKKQKGKTKGKAEGKGKGKGKGDGDGGGDGDGEGEGIGLDSLSSDGSLYGMTASETRAIDLAYQALVDEEKARSKKEENDTYTDAELAAMVDEEEFEERELERAILESDASYFQGAEDVLPPWTTDDVSL